jgi:integrase/recombinase XerD
LGGGENLRAPSQTEESPNLSPDDPGWECTSAQARESLPSLAKKRVSPHTIRHTTATHLLRAGVDINTIRAWLGHVSVDTTNVYAEVDLEMKAKALAACDTGGNPSTVRRIQIL